MHWYSDVLKPASDYVVAAVALLALGPIIIVLYFINVFVFGNGWFVQQRTGLNGGHFNCIKLRTLHKVGDDFSAPPWGRFLRTTSLDELPQFVNILRGEMSLIGPRALLPEYLPHYTAEQQTRHFVKPGITGLAQVSGRNALSWAESLALDAYYAEHVSFALDAKIVVLTFLQLFKFSQTKHQNMPNRTPFNQEMKK